MPWPYPADGAASHRGRTALARWRGARSRTGRSCLKDGPDELIGSIDLWPDDGVSRDQRGFWLDPAFQGQGLMTEAAERVTEYAFRELGWPCLWLSNAEDNQASAPDQGEAGRAAGRPRDRPLRLAARATRMVWLLEPRGLASAARRA